MRFGAALVFSLLFSFPSYSRECTQYEAQFIASVYDWKKDPSSQQCLYKLKFREFKPHVFCPLDIDRVHNVEFTDASCSMKDGKTLSGVLVLDLATGSYIFD